MLGGERYSQKKKDHVPWPRDVKCTVCSRNRKTVVVLQHKVR